MNIAQARKLQNILSKKESNTVVVEKASSLVLQLVHFPPPFLVRVCECTLGFVHGEAHPWLVLVPAEEDTGDCSQRQRDVLP